MIDARRLFDAVRGDIAGDVIAELLGETLAQASDLPSYAHPNGFLAFDLCEVEGADLRLHIWDGNVEPQADHVIHDHSYDLRSVIVAGGIRQTIWRDEAVSGGSLTEFKVEYEKGASRLVRTGREMTACAAKVLNLDRYMRYELPAGILHSVEPLGTRSATLFMRMLDEKSQNPRVLGRSDANNPRLAERCRVAPGIARAAIDQLLREIIRSK